MTIATIILALGIVYAVNEIKELKKSLSELSAQVYAERGLVWHFLRNSKALKEDMKAYKEQMLLVDDPLKSSIGELAGAFYDKMRFWEWLEEKEPFTYISDDPGQILSDKIDELLRAKILGIINSIQSANPDAINKHYAEWFAKEEGCSFYSCLSWMIPEIERSLISKKIAIPESFKELKEAVATGHLGELIPDIIEKAKQKN